MERRKIVLTCPHYTSEIGAAAAKAVYLWPTKDHQIVNFIDHQGSLLARGFNQMWCMGLELFDAQYADFFAMLHADIDPGKYWLDRLMQVMEEHEADVVSAVVPIKDFGGKTSTAIDNPKTEWEPLRHVMWEEMGKLPDVFDAADCGHPGHALLVNTGCMVVRLGEWCKPPAFSGFEIRDKVERTETGYRFATISEDWNFSRYAAQRGKKVLAVKMPGLKHWGTGAWTIPEGE